METPNLGGRPPIYESNEENYKKVSELCESYFETLDKESFDPPLVTMLALHLGFESKNTLYDYSKKDGFSDSIKRALTKIEAYHEKQTAGGDKCTGNIFVLKNFNWHDTVKTEHSGEINNPSATTISFKKFKKENE